MFEWTDENVAKLKSLLEQGLTRREIGIALGTTQSSVKCKIDRLGVKHLRPTKAVFGWTEQNVERLKGCIARNLSSAEISKELGASKDSIERQIKALQKAGPHWSEQARSMRLAGHKIQEIATALRKGRSSIARACEGIVCPIDHKQNQRKAAAKASHAPHVVRLPKTKQGFVIKRDYTPVVVSREDRIRRKLRAEQQKWEHSSQRAPVTLPRLKFLEGS